jgi:23S rRNA (cytidine1920-2'-O)/16S rRNA (cytidine1409-2'-O)-methyltransferase
MNAKAPKKKRADELLHDSKLTESRSKAQALIMAGSVEYSDSPLEASQSADDVKWLPVKKPGQLLPSTVRFKVEDATLQDVGRGAVKLRRALEHWSEIRAQGALALDVGASTGGFTQVLLAHGAAKVVALDVGTHQLHERLRKDERVISVEQQHVLRVDEALWERIGVRPHFDLIVTDLSFISLTKIIPTVSRWLKPQGSWVLLVKPQFEVGPQKAPGGIVRKEEFHNEAIAQVRSTVQQIENLEWVDLIPSPILGGDGNKEFLLWLKNAPAL